MAVTLFIFLAQAFTVQVTVDAGAERTPISPNIYGMNNALSVYPGQDLEIDWQRVQDAGVHLFRDHGGNNATKYNWRRKLSSHPDWYNNVYENDWDTEALMLQENLPGAQAMFAFQLIGKTAETDDYNFNDWEYNGSQWWEGVTNNWAGGGGPDEGEGDPELYLMDWPADSTVGILNHWFGDGGLGLDPAIFQYWNMDNEPAIWSGTHDDVMPEQLDAETFMQRYFEVAKKARAMFPDIKLAGPVAANEWQWYNWDGDKITTGGRSYTWLEYFIKRIGEEQAASGIRLLDVLDIHFYPGETEPADIVQLHRVWFDETYDYPGANGVKRSGPGAWDNSITREYIFERCRAWLDEYLGEDHGVTFGVSEMGVQSDDPNVVAIWYASTLGVFADEGVELFTPWDWKIGMWEVLHLFSRYGHSNSVQATSDDEAAVSAHASLNAAADSLTLILINRSLDDQADVAIDLAHFDVADGAYTTLLLDDLPAEETFVSHEDNALTEGTTTVEQNTLSLDLPALSVTAVLLAGEAVDVARDVVSEYELVLDIYPNPFQNTATVSYSLPEAGPVRIELFDMLGRHTETAVQAQQSAGAHTYTLDGSHLASGMYVLQLTAGSHVVQKLITVVK